MRISQLEGRRVALWGWGREARAAYRAVRGRLPTLPLTVFCMDPEAQQVAALGDRFLQLHTEAPGAQLAAFEVVLKSPGISPYTAETLAAAAAGSRVIGGTALWFAEQAGAGQVAQGTLCVTGTKGKSTTTALLAHLLRAGGHVTALAGNIGLPLLELPEPNTDPNLDPEFWAIELSSFQTRDVAASGVRPDVAVVLNLYPEHLDWHGSESRYFADKLALLVDAKPRIAVLNAQDARQAGLALPDSEVRWFGRADGWHVRDASVFRRDERMLDGTALPLPGEHNLDNLCAALTAIDALGLNAAALAPHAADFRPLPHRLQTLGVRDGVRYVNDSISTTPHASIAALRCFAGGRVAILVGGHDRGLDWEQFAQHVSRHPPVAVVTMGEHGGRIHALLAALPTRGFPLHRADDLAAALVAAKAEVGTDGVVLLSPGAPSFGAYRDYVERGRHFAQLAGFDPDTISAIPGLGIA
ncbi:MAG TPA: UDP-N-acetylmuramoyl-L-alanine--D-glutamate ligase [Xanthomonadaceae bacterium]|nr:UDP-N-acetylmuramoyl-L-alanine--D-glutamate ligase [Xanthomonadaceae bacterium]